MRTIEETIYNYDELSEDVKQKLLEKERENQLESYCEFCLYEDMKYQADIYLNEYFNNGKVNDVYYDLSYCQGSGSMIAFTINFEDLNNKYHILNDEEMRFIKDRRNARII